MSGVTFQIKPVRSAADLQATIQLFQAYVTSLGIDLAYQDFATEVTTMPGKYAPPSGELLLACDAQGEPMGCVGLRQLPHDGCCEMKRLYVAPSGRGLGLGRKLVDAILEEAARIGYREIRLDTLPDMVEALALYRKAGFTPIDSYYSTPVVGTKFLSRSLTI